MNNIVNLLGDSDAYESEEALKRVYGEDAVFSKVGVFTLVHLDNPTQETIARRTNDFDPQEFFVDDCPRCEASRNHGGHIVFNTRDRDREDVASYAATPLKAPAVELLRALDRLDGAARALVRELEPIADSFLYKRAIEDIGFLHDRFVEMMWAEEKIAPSEVFEQQLARALTTLKDVFIAHPHLDPVVSRVDAAIDSIAEIWRAL